VLQQQNGYQTGLEKHQKNQKKNIHRKQAKSKKKFLTNRLKAMIFPF